MTEHPENYEDVTVFGLDEDVEEQLLLAQMNAPLFGRIKKVGQ